MVLATHLVTGGILGRALANPWTALFFGLLSHFLLDAIPHWDYRLGSRRANKNDKLDVDMAINRDFGIDLAKIGIDLTVGVVVLFLTGKLFAWPVSATIIWGAIGGVLPDFLQFVYFKLRWPALRQLQRFHIWVHAERKLDDWPVLGPLLQVILALAVIILAGKLF